MSGHGISGDHVLLIQDTTELNFGWRSNELKNLGPTGNPKDQGFFLHPGLFVDAENETLEGLGSFELWHRERGVKTTKNEGHKSKPIEEKESNRWLT